MYSILFYEIVRFIVMGAFHVLKDMAKVAVAAASLGALPRPRTCFPPLRSYPPLLSLSRLFSVWQHGPLIDAKRPLELRLNFNFLPHKRHLSAPLFYLPHSLSGRLICPQTVAGPRQASVSISLPTPVPMPVPMLSECNGQVDDRCTVERI